ncbi:MAG: hypothetical protein IKI20_04280 [Lachnospiraceae bacterium]|nr:hypothetical protein [Lachnospiraceae bacterium]
MKPNKFFTFFVAGIATIIFGMLVALLPGIKAFAAGAVTFGSISYAPLPDTDFPVGVYAQSNDGLQVGTFSITLSYDPNVLTYVSGGTSGGNGTVTITGFSPDGNRKQNMLTFHAAKSGTTNLVVTAAIINDVTGTPMTLDPFPSVPITIQAGKTVPPKSLKINGKEVPGLADGRTEYTFSIPYADEVKIEAPDGYTIKTDTKELEVGRNDIKLEVSNNGGDPIIYTLHVNMEPDRSETTSEDKSEDKSEDGSEAASEKAEAAKETEKKSEKTSEKKSEVVLPPMPESMEKPVEEEKNEMNYILVLAGFLGLILLVVLFKLIHDAIMDRKGETTDVKKVLFKRDLAKQEKIEETADPFTYATIDDKENEGTNSNLDFHLKTPEEIKKNEATTAGNAEVQAEVDANIPKLDFSKRRSAASIAREELKMAEEEKKTAPADTGNTPKKSEIEEYWDAMKDTGSGNEEDFVDLDDVAERKPKK